MGLTLRQQAADDATVRADYARRLFTDTLPITYVTPGMVVDVPVTLQEILQLMAEGATVTVTIPHA